MTGRIGKPVRIRHRARCGDPEPPRSTESGKSEDRPRAGPWRTGGSPTCHSTTPSAPSSAPHGDMALALTLTTISPAVGGVLVRGEKGTAKSTMVRGLASVLPPIEVIAGDRFSTDPHETHPLSPDGPFAADAPTESRPVRLVELPVGATEDRVLGSLHLEKALSEGVTTYEPGLLARAHRGILYVDEVNLLHDHLVDLLLDAAAMGRSTVERDGVSIEHAAQFVLVGTMNPEEGELRPQLLDRFGLTVEVSAPRDPAPRRGGQAPAGLRGRPRRVRRPLRRRRGRAHRPHPGRAEARREVELRRGRSPRSPRSARRSTSTACAPTSSPPGPPPPTPPGTAAPTCSRRTSAPPPGWRCRTDAAATRSTPRASTRTCSTRSSTTTNPSRLRRRRRGRTAARLEDGPEPAELRPDAGDRFDGARHRRP